MRKTKPNRDGIPTPRKGVSVLPAVYSLLFLALAAGAGWLYWLDMSNDAEFSTAAITPISPPEKEDEHGADEHEAVEESHDTHADPQSVKSEIHRDTSELEEVSKEHATNSQRKETANEHSETMEEHGADTPPAEDVNQSSAQADPDKTKEHSVETDPTNLTSGHSKKTQHPEAPENQIATKSVPSETLVNPEDATAPQKGDTAHTPNTPSEAEEASKEVASLPDPVAPLPPVPDPDLTKNSDYGLLPIISPTGKLPWRIYSRPFDDPLDRPRIAIIMSEMGMSKNATKSTIQNLPGSVTLSFNPYARDLQSWIEQARAAGHEVLLQLPMEPFGYPKNDPGPNSLLTSLTDRENLKRLDWMLGRFAGYTGVTNQMGSKFTASEADIRPVLDVIKSRGLLFLDGRTSAKSVAGQLAAESGIPVAINNRFLDHKADRATIDARLKDLERIARYTGTAVGIGYPYPVTLERISRWAATLARKGFVLVPVSAAINRQEIQ